MSGFGGPWGGKSEYVCCPYDRNHTVHRSRIQYHIVKCARSHKDIKLEVCPYNASHRMLERDYKFHVANCPDRVEEFPFGSSSELQRENLHSPKSLSNVKKWDDDCTSSGIESDFTETTTIGTTSESTDEEAHYSNAFKGAEVRNSFSRERRRDDSGREGGSVPSSSGSTSPKMRLPYSLPPSIRGLGIERKLGIE